ncbi:MAG: PEP-CTERM sorting domain-containing protein [Methylococcaceae bacterium]
MQNIIIMIIFVAFGSWGGIATAAQFTLTETLKFNSTIDVASATFDGTVSGDLIRDLTNISVFYNGHAFSGNGSLIADSNSTLGTWLAGGAQVSFSGTQNNFNFHDGSLFSSGVTNYFFDIGQSPFFQSAWGQGAQYNDIHTDSYADTRSSRDAGNQIGSSFKAFGTYTFTITDSQTTVPEPTSIALIGMGLFGFAASRRKKHQA